MYKLLKVRLLEDLDLKINDSKYMKNQILTVIELPSFKDSYAYQYEINQQGAIVATLDWIPKEICKVIEVLQKNHKTI